MLPRFYLITDSRQAAAPLDETLAACFDAGARLVQLREKHLPHDELAHLAARLVPLAHNLGAKLLINTHAELAREADADGVHRPAHGPAVGELRREVGRHSIIGVSTHSLAEVRAAEEQGADFVTLSPIFETASKPGYGPALGLDELRKVCEAVDVPVFALAGVTPERAKACLQAGAYGVAVMGGVMRAKRPARAVRAYLEAVR